MEHKTNELPINLTTMMKCKKSVHIIILEILITILLENVHQQVLYLLLDTLARKY